ncbi:putative quinol monooxygenase [Jeongeupia wiesaeckerbachi]|uniref:putative quinol monooxygenase n=1 Tax=Jeongeupia wiesaeckerbachi TaxID=3051218 RepID=UPI003D808C26
MPNTIHIVAKLTAKPGQKEQVRRQALSMVAPSRAEPGCLAYQVYVDPHDDASWVVIEEWADQAAFEAHLSSPHLMAAQAAAETLLACPPQLTMLTQAENIPR